MEIKNDEKKTEKRLFNFAKQKKKNERWKVIFHFEVWMCQDEEGGIRVEVRKRGG